MKKTFEPPKKPTENELKKKLSEAIAIVQAKGKFIFANDAASMAEIRSEGHDIDTLEEDILTCLREIQSTDYAGQRPPTQSYEKKIEGNDLFPFAWESTHKGKRMYLKFVIKNGYFYYVSFHADR